MCHNRKVKQLGRCKTCRETRCIECAGELALFVRMIHVKKLRKKQWEHQVYEHETDTKTKTFERLCINPECPKFFDIQKLGPQWQQIAQPKAEAKSFDDAIDQLEDEVALL
jgi:hypothetical protein